MVTVTQTASGVVLRRRWVVRGQIQGVGFRPFVYRAAMEQRLSGFVMNDGAGVVIEAQGSEEALAAFIDAVCRKGPALAEIRSVEDCDLARVEGEQEFRIASSEHDHGPVGADVTVDTAVCDACLAEMFASKDRRHRYGLINCTDCGPRYSIITRVPYDRPNTTMAGFEMCAACRAEYESPADRRFHAQPVACHECGPQVTYAKGNGEAVADVDPVALAAKKLLEGSVIAIKGLGGFHLAVRADREDAVKALRMSKHRESKPFAVMCRDVGAACELVELSEEGKRLLSSAARPIVLATRKAKAPIANAVAPRSHRLGVMVPYTPLQHLLFGAMGKSAVPLVMTSANVGEEPLVFENEDAVRRLGAMCEGYLWHDRAIARPVDDSVVIDMGDDEPVIVRRARGYVPGKIELPVTDRRAGVALGGELKSTVAVVKDGAAVLSQHLGDLTHPRTYHLFGQTIKDLCGLFGVKPKWIAHDLHPSYLSTVHAGKMASALRVPMVGVQHHHAHAAAVMAEHGVKGPVLAVVCDGTGYGTDGTIWGGELLVADLTGFKRLARIRPMLLAGGDAAAKDPRRCALAAIQIAYGAEFERHPIVEKLAPDARERGMLLKMLAGGVSCVPSSSAGRLFDAAAAILSICQEQQFEAQAAMALESAAHAHSMRGDARQLFAIRRGRGHPGEIDFSLLIREMVDQSADGTSSGELAGLFHEQFCQAWCRAVLEAVEKTGLLCVALSGGVFCNAIVSRRLVELLVEQGLHVLQHRAVPPNDGGLALGQAAVASARAAGGMLGKAGG